MCWIAARHFFARLLYLIAIRLLFFRLDLFHALNDSIRYAYASGDARCRTAWLGLISRLFPFLLLKVSLTRLTRVTFCVDLSWLPPISS